MRCVPDCRRVHDTLVIVPAFNEEQCIGQVVIDVRRAGYDCLVVDDGSLDDTSRVARDSSATVVRLAVNLGVGAALRTAFRYAVQSGYTQVVQVDADGQHVISEIAKLMGAADAGVDMVIGSRFAGQDSGYQMSRIRRACIRLLASRVRAAGPRLSDPTSGFRIIRQPLLGAYAVDFPAHYLGDTFEAALVAGRRGYSVTEVPVQMRPRQGGHPSADLMALVRAMVRSVAVILIGPSFDIKPKSVTDV